MALDSSDSLFMTIPRFLFRGLGNDVLNFSMASAADETLSDNGESVLRSEYEDPA